ncbi:hypothetical protein ROSMUCSMR3_02850 [Roseovarius mucosus]|uniref:Uncharacterized protein n=1 Tax=Roseovarius mucosus TaxID=215743 RepID=A0A1V0RRB2_9RHOB|nr:hypothetical protein ROSMUCSMR3_02850 [Roseovarius mucosus]
MFQAALADGLGFEIFPLMQDGFLADKVYVDECDVVCTHVIALALILSPNRRFELGEGALQTLFQAGGTPAEHALPVSGLELTRHWQLARADDGQIVLWQSWRRRTGAKALWRSTLRSHTVMLSRSRRSPGPQRARKDLRSSR